MVFGIPDEALFGGIAAIVILVVALKILGGKKAKGAPKPPRHHGAGAPEAGGVAPEEHTGLEDLIDKPGGPKLPSAETVEEEEQAGMSVETGSLESLLARPIDEAPSIGEAEKTDVDSGLDLVKFEKGAETPIKPEVPKEMKTPEPVKKEPEIPASAKDLARLHEQFGEEFNIDEMGDIVAVPEERPAYKPPGDIEAKATKEAETKRPVKLYDQPKTQRKENLKRYCMLQYDSGNPPKKVENVLRVKGMTHTTAKQLAFKTYRIWIEKREPLIRQIKETRDMVKRIEYKYLKRQIDATTRKKSLNEANKKLAELESKLKSSEDYFE